LPRLFWNHNPPISVSYISSNTRFLPLCLTIG
jgi:hypothetical protein